jgi:hypothetical protein
MTAMKGRCIKLPLRIDDYAVYIGGRFSLSFQRTLRVPEGGLRYPNPPRLGNFRVHRVEDYATRVPPEWADSDGIFIPMYQREALWLAFGGVAWKPSAVMVGAGERNAIAVEPIDGGLQSSPQNYAVSPHQPWLAGAAMEGGKVRQFVPPPLAWSVQSSAGAPQEGATWDIEVIIYDPKAGIFPAEPPRLQAWPEADTFEESVQPYRVGASSEQGERQDAYPLADPYGFDTWENEPCGRITVHLVNMEQYRRITGLEAPYTPTSANTYQAANLPWLESYSEEPLH